MPDLKQFALNMLQNNPAVAASPLGQQAMQIFQNGDTAKGQEMASNILNSYGLTKEQAMKDISQKLNIPL